MSNEPETAEEMAQLLAEKALEVWPSGTEVSVEGNIVTVQFPHVSVPVRIIFTLTRTDR
jgi:hypothetical protein